MNITLLLGNLTTPPKKKEDIMMTWFPTDRCIEQDTHEYGDVVWRDKLKKNGRIVKLVFMNDSEPTKKEFEKLLLKLPFHMLRTVDVVSVPNNVGSPKINSLMDLIGYGTLVDYLPEDYDKFMVHGVTMELRKYL